MIHTSFRLPMSIVQRLDAMAEALRKKNVGKVTRADVLRLLIAGGLSKMERQLRDKDRAR